MAGVSAESWTDAFTWHNYRYCVASICRSCRSGQLAAISAVQHQLRILHMESQARAPLLSDYLKAKLDQLDLSRKVSAKFVQLDLQMKVFDQVLKMDLSKPPSMQEAKLGVKY